MVSRTTTAMENIANGYQQADPAHVILRAISTVLSLALDEITSIAQNTTFVKLGGDSLASILIVAECRKDGIWVPASTFLRSGQSLEEAIANAAKSARREHIDSATASGLKDVPSTVALPHIETQMSGPPYFAPSLCEMHSKIPCGSDNANALPSHNESRMIRASTLLARTCTSDWTEQQLLLLQESSNDQNRNVLTLHRVYSGEWDAQYVCDIWTRTILAEPIFRDLSADLAVTPSALLPRQIVWVDSEEKLHYETQNAVTTTGPLSHLSVIKFASTSVVIIWRVHHSLMDGFSARIIHNKVSLNYSKNKSHGASVTPGPSFKDTVRALSKLRREKRESTAKFWAKKHECFPHAAGELRLSPQQQRTRATDGLMETPQQRCVKITLNSADLAAARERTGYTNTVYFASAWALTLSKFMDTDQVCFGMVLSGRDLPISGSSEVVGPLINVLPLFVQLPRESGQQASTRAFLGLVQEGILELAEVQHSDASDGLQRPFRSIIATQLDDGEETEAEQDLLIRSDHDFPGVQVGMPLSLVIRGQCHLQIFYSTDHYSAEDMANIRSCLETCLRCLLSGDYDEKQLTPSVHHEVLIPPTMEGLIRKWSNCESFETLDESKDDDLVTLFESVVAKQPTAEAIARDTAKDEREVILYGELDLAAIHVARELVGRIQPNEPVGVYADRSPNWIVAILGILKAGGVYAPLDPSAPAAISAANIVRSGARTILFPSTDSISTYAAHSLYDCVSIAVEDILNKSEQDMEIMQQAGAAPLSLFPRRGVARPDDTAYICFTSGSSGHPKAVQCTHKGLVAFQKDHAVRLASERGTVIAQVMSPVFDGSIHEIFATLTYGATLLLPPSASSLNDGTQLFSHLKKCNSATLTPSLASALDPDQYPLLTNVYMIGEPVTQSVCDAWAKNHDVYNMYGPTEATCGATIKQLTPGKAVTLGHPNVSSRVYVLDRNQLLLPPGSVGELYIAGIQVSNGYIDLPAENSQLFLPDSILHETGQRMYRTGDFAYRESITGDICILGRRDRQIKLHGFRLDLNDLEARIVRAIPCCKAAAVFLRLNHLVAAYQIPRNRAQGEPLVEDEVRRLIRDALPPYAMPRRIFGLSSLPLTAAGKLNYAKLEEMDDANSSSLVQAQPRAAIGTTESEAIIVRSIRDLMNFDSKFPIGRDSDLRALGGHSIVQLRLASRISSLIGRRFAVRNVIENPIISQLAALVDKAKREGPHYVRTEGNEPRGQSHDLSGNDTNGASEDASRVSPIESVWFWRYQSEPRNTSSFNVSHVSKLDERFDRHLDLVSAWTKVMERHAILRCRYQPSENAPGGVERSYVVGSPTAQFVDSNLFDFRAFINRGFSLGAEHPIRIVVSRTHMVICASHIVCDYSTLERLFEEFTAEYSLCSSPICPESSTQYQETACSWSNFEIDPRTVSFWQKYLAGLVRVDPPYMTKARQSLNGESCMFRLSKDISYNLEMISKSLHLTRHQVALGIVSLVLQLDSSAKQDIILGGPYLGRQEEDMGTIGLFLEPLPIRVPGRSKNGHDLCEARVVDYLLAVQESARSALGHSLQWTTLMELISSDTSSDEVSRSAATKERVPRNQNHPLFDAMVTFHEQESSPPSSSSSGVEGVEPLITWTEGSKFAIMFEFSTTRSSSITLRVEYDSSIFTADEVLLMASRIDHGLRFLDQKSMSSSMRVCDLEHAIAGGGYGGAEPGTKSEIKIVEFGTRLADI